MYMRREKEMIVAALASTYALIDAVGTLDHVSPDDYGGEEQKLRTLAVNDMVVDLESVGEMLEIELTR